MTYVVLLPVVAVILAIILSVYLRAATARLKLATQFWPLVEQSATKLISEKYPPALREMAFRLGVTTGCGCYVTALLLHHYTPWLAKLVERPHRDRKTGVTVKYSEAVASLDTPQKRQVDTLIAAVLAYDALAHPIRGWLVMRMVKIKNEQTRKPQDLPTPSREAKEAVITTLESRSPRKREVELCVI